MKRTSIVTLLVLVEAAAVGVPWRQHVRIALSREGVALSGRQLRLVTGGPNEVCNVRGLEGTTDIDGRFDGARWQWSTAIALIDVVVRRDALCLFQPDGTWVKIWDLPYGPAPKDFTLTCNLPSPRGSASISPVETEAGYFPISGPNAHGVIDGACRLASNR